MAVWMAIGYTWDLPFSVHRSAEVELNRWLNIVWKCGMDGIKCEEGFGEIRCRCWTDITSLFRLVEGLGKVFSGWGKRERRSQENAENEDDCCLYKYVSMVFIIQGVRRRGLLRIAVQRIVSIGGQWSFGHLLLPHSFHYLLRSIVPSPPFTSWTSYFFSFSFA